MKIKEIYGNFAGDVADYFGLNIEIDSFGIDCNVDELVEKAKHFGVVIIRGTDIFYQKDDITKLIKKLRKIKPSIKFIIYTNATHRPLSILENVQYWINIQLKHTNIDYNKRIIPTVLEWYLQLDTNFIFNIITIDDFDEAELLMTDLGVPKGKVFFRVSDKIPALAYKDVFNDIRRYCRTNNYHYIMDVGMVMDDGA